MRAFIFKIFCTTFVLAAISATAGSSMGCDNDPWCVKLSVAYFRPTDDKVRKIYSDAWANYQFELSRTLFNSNWAAWGSVDWSGANGEALYIGSQPVSKDKTNLWILPLSFGLQYYLPVDRLNGRFYLGGGASVAFVRITDDHDHVKKNLSKNGAWGGILKSGFQYFFCNSLFLDVFMNYSFQKVRFSNEHTNVQTSDAHLDGLKIGAGLGLCF